MRTILLSLCLLFGSALSTLRGQEAPVNIPTSLWEEGQDQPIPFLVWLKTRADLEGALRLRSKEEKSHWVFRQLENAYRSDQKTVGRWLESEGAPAHNFLLVNVIATRGDHRLMKKLAALPEVKAIVPDPRTSLNFLESDPGLGQARQEVEWGIDQIKANQVWELGFQGQGITVGGQDTGYDWDHPALKKQYRGYQDGQVRHDYHWHDAIRELSPVHNDPNDLEENNPCGFDAQEPCDDGFHGTHTIGIAVGDDGLGNRIGVAPQARWIGCRNMDRGYGYPSSYLECFDWLLAPRDLHGRNPDPGLAPHVINNSWSCPSIEGCNAQNWAMLEEAVEALRAAGIVVVVSAGNQGPNCQTAVNAPARFEGSFSIGAIGPDGWAARFTSRGPIPTDDGLLLKPNVVAPGVNIRSAIPGEGYRNLNGTSMSGPMVAGTVALLLSANPALAGQVDRIEQIIEETAVPVKSGQDCEDYPGGDHPNAVYGYGQVDALRAVQAALELRDSESGQAVQMDLYPNPVSNFLFLSAKGISGSASIRIYDVTGQLLWQSREEAQQVLVRKIDLSFLPSGMYLLSLDYPGGSIRRKVVRH
jgi:subtilisin family serine protease